MADTKASALAAFTPVLTDEVYAVDDPNGTPVSGVNTYTAVQTLLDASTSTLTNKTITAPVLGGTVTGTYTLGGTPTLGGALAAGGNNITDLGDVTFQTGATGGTLQTGTSNADKFVLQAYDVDGAAYQTVLELDAGNDPILQLRADFLEIDDETDGTKKVTWDVSGATTSTATDLAFVQTANRTITFPDVTGTLVVQGGALGTPSSGVATNLTGTASGLTAGNVTTNANLTGHVTSTGNAAVLGSFTAAQLNTAVSDATLAILGANTFTGTQDFNGQQVEAMLNKVVSSVTGALTTTDHSGNILVTSGNVTVPTTAGFNAVIIAGGAHTVTFNATTSAAMAAGDVMTVFVESGTVIHAVLTAAADKVTFS